MTIPVMAPRRPTSFVSLVIWIGVGLAVSGFSEANVVETHGPAGLKAAGQWTQTGSLITGRVGHTATRLRDGQVLVAGGDAPNARSLDSAELYDPIARAWRSTARLVDGRSGHKATLLADGRVLVTGGRLAVPGYRWAEFYEPVARVWTRTGNMIARRTGHSATLLADGRVLVAGGVSEGIQATAEIYDPATNVWSATGNLSVQRSDHTATLLASGKVLVVGGMEVAGHLIDETTWGQTASAELYDPTTGTWARLGNLNHARQEHTATLLLNGKLLVAGGFATNPSAGVGVDPRYLVSSESFDPATGRWTAESNLPDALEAPEATTLPSGNVLVTGRPDRTYSAPAAFAGAALYDVGRATWERAPAFATERASYSQTLLSDGTVLAVGGSSIEASAAARADIYEPVFSIDHRLTGTWFDADLSGHGLVIQVLPGGRLLSWWFTFNPAGTEQAWFGGVGTYSGNTATISEVSQTSGGRWIPNFDPRTIVNNAWGTFTFTFTNLDHGWVDFDSVAGFGSDGMTLRRITRPTVAPPLAREAVAGAIGPGFTGVWFNPGQSGHGLFVEVLPDNRLSAWWFTFTPDGRQQAWFGGVGTYQGNTAVIDEVVQPTGGRWIPNFNPGQIRINPWGSLRLTFRDCANGTVAFNSTRGFGSGSLEVQRLTSPLGQTCP